MILVDGGTLVCCALARSQFRTVAWLKLRMFALIIGIVFISTLGSTSVPIPNENDGILWNITFELNSTYNTLGQPRVYHVTYPSKDIYTNVPVIMHFHGGNGEASSAAVSTQLVAKAAPLGFMTVFAEGYLMSSGGRKWSGGSCCGECAANVSCSCYINDVQYVSGVIQGLVETEYIREDNPVFASGHSNGGIMSYRLYCELGDKISGIAVAESFNGYYDAGQCLVDCNSDDHLCYSNSTPGCSEEIWTTALPEFFPCSKENVPSNSILSFQGSKDIHVLIDGGACTDETRCAAHGTSYVPYNFQVNYNAILNGCDMNLPATKTFRNESSVDENDTSECFSYQGCTKNTTYCIQYNGGHTWPGKQYDQCDENSDSYNAVECAYLQWYVGPTITSLHATELLVDFFKMLMDHKDY